MGRTMGISYSPSSSCRDSKVVVQPSSHLLLGFYREKRPTRVLEKLSLDGWAYWMEQVGPSRTWWAAVDAVATPTDLPLRTTAPPRGLLGTLAADGPFPGTALCQRALSPRTVLLSKGCPDLLTGRCRGANV